MQHQSWREVMSAYYNANISSIPLNKKRQPLVNGWSRWNEELPDECLYNETQAGIGVLPGPASGIMFVDIDTDDKELILKLKEILPTSPVQRFGSKGVGIAYAYNEKLKSRKFRNIKVELFIDSGYLVLPPSYHEKTGGHYKWLGPSLLEFDKENLPTFDETVISRLEALDQKLETNEKSGVGNRHDMLLKQAFAGLHGGKDLDKIAEELASYDLKNHNPSWFKEEMKAKTEADVLKVALKFTENVAKTYEKKNPLPDISEIEVASKEEKFEIKSYPVPTGVMGSIYKLIQAHSYTYAPNITLGATLAVYSTLVGNSYSFQRTYGNLFCLILAPSGTGKKFGIEVAKDLLDEYGRTRRANYVSGPDIKRDLTDFCIKLDLADEFSTTLNLMTEGGVWQKSIPSELCELWSASGGKIFAAAKKDQKNCASITQPYISMLAATTISGFKRSVNNWLFESGFIPRCLFFLDYAGPEAVSTIDENYLEALTEEVRIYFRSWVLNHSNFMADVTNGTTKMTLADDAVSYFDEKLKSFYKDILKQPEDSIEQIMLTRKREQYKKLAMLHSLSRDPKNAVITKEDLDWAELIFDTSYHNQKIFIKEASSENEQQAMKERLYSIILQNPGISRRDLARKTQSFGKKQRESLLEDLLDAERVCEHISSVGRNGKRLRSFSAIAR